MNRAALTCTAIGVALLLALPVSARAEAYDGLTLVNPLLSTTMRLITNDGRAVNTWHCGKGVGYVPYLMPDSTVWRPGKHPASSLRPSAWGGLIERYNWDGDIIQSFEWSGPDHIQHHDIEPLPNGNVLVLSLDRYTADEARARGRVNITSSHIWSEMIVEYDPVADSVVWEWRFWDRLVQDADPGKPDYGVISEHPHRLDINAGPVEPSGDWIHANGLDYCPVESLVVVSSRILNEFFIIDHATTTEEARGSTGGRHGRGGDFLYRWGNPRNYGRGTAADQRFFVVHDANFIRPGLPGAGNILVFNNGNRPDPEDRYSSVEEIVLPRDARGGFHLHPDSGFGPDEPAWSYSNPGGFHSASLGGARRLPNGNTLITEGTRSRVFEVTSDGRVVWTYNLGRQTGRVLKYPRAFAAPPEEPEEPSEALVSPTVTRGLLRIREEGTYRAELADAAGRRLVALAPGINDIAHLRPGVYFVRTMGHRTALTKILLTR